MTTRRAFLRGAGATLALPYLNWSTRAEAAPPDAPKRFIVFINGEGNLNHPLCDQWTPPNLADGSLDLSKTPMLSALTAYQQRMVVIRGVDNALHDLYKSANGHLGSGHTFLSASLPRNAVDNGGNYIPLASQADIGLDTCCVGPSLLT